MPNPHTRLNLATATFNPAVFTPQVFTPQQVDMNLLAKSFDKMEERERIVSQQKGAINKALSDVKLNASEDEWKQNYIYGIQNQIKALTDEGDYSGALNRALDLANTSLADPALKGRIRANEQYEEEIKRQKARVDRGDISQNTYAWWLKNNPYSYSDLRDNNGNVIGGTEYEPKFRPVNDINWASAAMAAFKMITPYKNSVSTDGGSSVTNNTGAAITRNGTTYKPGESVSGSGHSSHSEERITKEEITARMEELLSSTPDGYRQAEQAFDVAFDEFKTMTEKYNALVKENPISDEAKDLAQKIDARKKLMYRNGSLIDYKEYYARMISNSLYAEGLAYDWNTTSSGGTSSYSLSDASGGSGGGGRISSQVPFVGSTFNYQTGLWEGPLTRQELDSERAQISVVSSGAKITNRFGG